MHSSTTAHLQQTNPHKSRSNDSFLDRLKNLLQRIPLAGQPVALLAVSKLQQSAHAIRILHVLQQLLRLIAPPLAHRCEMLNKIVRTIQRPQLLRVVVKTSGQSDGGQNPHIEALLHRLRVLREQQQQHVELRLSAANRPHVLLAVVVVQQTLAVVGFAQRAQRQLRRERALLQQLPLRAGDVVSEETRAVQIVKKRGRFGAGGVGDVLEKMGRSGGESEAQRGQLSGERHSEAQQRLRVAQQHGEVAGAAHLGPQRREDLGEELGLRDGDVSVELARATVLRSGLHVGGELLDALRAVDERRVVLRVRFAFLRKNALR